MKLVMMTSKLTQEQVERQREKGKRERKEEIGKERANKMARVKWGRGKREVNGK